MAEADPRQQVLNRLKRARGQLSAVIDMVEQDKPCPEVLTQLAAVSKALDRAGFKIISTGVRDCLADEDGTGRDGVTVDQLEKLFLSLA